MINKILYCVSSIIFNDSSDTLSSCKESAASNIHIKALILRFYFINRKCDGLSPAIACAGETTGVFE